MSATSPIRRWMSPPPVYDAHAVPRSTTTLKPYLELPYLLSLTWLAYPILSLIFVAFRLQISSASAQDSVASAKENLLASCRAAERAATATASMPRYMAIASNQQFVDAVNGTMEGAREALILSLTAMEAIINFLVDIYRSTFFCFLELIVRGTLSILIGAVQEISDFITSTLSGLRTSIQNDVTSVNSAIQTAIDGINKVNPFGDITAPQFSIPSLDALQNVTIPTDFEDSLIKLNSSLPSIDDIKNKLEAIIDTPFELVKKDINDTFLGVSFNSSVFAVPEQNTLSFCNDVDTSFVDDLGIDLVKVTKIGTIIIIAIIILMILGNCAFEWYKWRSLQQHLQYTREAWNNDPTIIHSGPNQANPTMVMTNHNLLTLAGTTAHPLLTRIANTLAALLHLSTSQHIHLQWFFHYVFHPPALACFLIGSMGLASVQLQLLAIGPLAAKYSAQTATSVADFSNTIATSVNDSMYNQSATYANSVNTHVDLIQNTINDGVFGWVNQTTTTLNSTLVGFYAEVQDLVTTVFGGTILENPMQEFVKCIIGTKVDALENALTFMHDNLHVNIARMNESVLVLSPANINEATQPIAEAAVGSGSDGDGGIVGRIVRAYVASLKKEEIMFLIFIGLWGFVVVIALLIILWHSYGKGWVESYKKRKWHQEQREGFDQFAGRAATQDISFANSGNERGQVELPSFTPMPSAKSGFLDVLSSPRRRIGSPTSSPRQDSSKVSPQHPLRSLKPDFEKSWDSFIDASAKDVPVKQKSGKVLGFGKKGWGDDEKRPNVTHFQQPAGKGWLQRTVGTLWKKEDAPLVTPYPRGGSPRRVPNLSISTDHANATLRRDGLPTIETTSPSENNNGLASTWSVSPPVPRPQPWNSPVVAPVTKESVSFVGPLRPPRPRINLDDPVNLMRDMDVVHKPTIMMPPNPTPLALPLHHGYQRPIPSGMPRSVSVSPAPIPSQQYLAPPMHPTRRPPGLKINPNPQENPFDSPFDQSPIVPVTNPFASPTSANPRASVRQMNPFEPVAY